MTTAWNCGDTRYRVVLGECFVCGRLIVRYVAGNPDEVVEGYRKYLFSNGRWRCVRHAMKGRHRRTT